MARSRGDSAKDRADWRRLKSLAEKHGWDDEPDDPKHRVYFIEGTLDQLHDMGFHLADLGAQGATEDEDEPEQEPETETEGDEPEPDPEPEPEPKPRSRARYFGGR